MIRLFRRVVMLFIAGGLFLAGLAGWYAYVHYTDPELVRRLIVAAALERLPGAVVTLDMVEGQVFGGLRLVGLRVAHQPRSGETAPRDIITLPSVSLSLDESKLWDGKIAIKRVVIEKPTIHLRRDKKGHWEVSDWVGETPPIFPSAAEIRVVDGTIIVSGLPDVDGPLTLGDVDVDFDVSPPNTIIWKGGLREGRVGALRTQGSMSLTKCACHVEMETAEPCDLALAREMAPARFKEKIQAFEPIVGEALVNAVAEGSWGPGRFDWDAVARVVARGVSFEHESLPAAVTDANGVFTLRPDELEVEELSFRIGGAVGDGKGRVTGWKVDEAVGEGRLRGIEFTEALYQRLTPSLRELWDRFAPEGKFDLAVKRTWTDDRLTVTGQARLRDVAGVFAKFPYPARAVNGVILLHPDGHISLDLAGMAGKRPATLKGTCSKLVQADIIDLQLEAKGAPLDDALRSALPPSSAAILDNFVVEGTADVVCAIGRRKLEEPIGYRIEAELSCPVAKCAWFPYELDHVTGRLIVTAKQFEYQDVVGSSSGGTTRISGRTTLTPEGPKVEVDVWASKVPLDEKLRAALPVSQKPVWDTLRPEGRADVWATIRKEPAAPLTVTLTIDPAAASITPTPFPYRLEEFAGRVDHEAGRTWWKNVRARHAGHEIVSSGEVRQTPDGGIVRLTNVRAENIPVDKEFLTAAPAGLRAICQFLGPDQPIGVAFPALQVQWNIDPTLPPRYFFEGELAVRQTNLIPSVGMKNVTGKATLVGQGVGETRTIEGNLALANMTIAGFSAQNVTSRVDVKDNKLKLTKIRGELYGGEVFGVAQASFDQEARYEVDIRAYQARLARYMREVSANHGTVDGLVDAQLYIHGDGKNIGRLQGRGRVTVREADIGGMPIIQDIFRLLSLQAPNGRAFDEVDCVFRLQDRTATIQKLDLLGPKENIGPSLSLMSSGEGTIDLDTLRLQLKLAPRFARGQFKIPVISDAFNFASDNLIEIPVGGTLASPEPLVDTLPGLRRAITAPARRNPHVIRRP